MLWEVVVRTGVPLLRLLAAAGGDQSLTSFLSKKESEGRLEQ